MSDTHFQKLTRMYLGAPINRYFAPRIEISRGQAVVTLPVREDFHHAASAVHGAVYFKALDDAARKVTADSAASFWDEASDGTDIGDVRSDTLSWEQAQKLGLLPKK